MYIDARGGGAPARRAGGACDLCVARALAYIAPAAAGSAGTHGRTRAPIGVRRCVRASTLIAPLEGAGGHRNRLYR